MCRSVTVIIGFWTFIVVNSQSTDEEQGSTYSNNYAVSTVNFHDIYTNNLDMISDEPSTFTHRNTHTELFKLSQSPESQAQTVGQRKRPPPNYIFHRPLVQNMTTTSSTTSATTVEMEEISVKVLPIKNDLQRGVLDLLFPAARVRTFKSVFDSVRRILSHTFKK